MVLVLLMQLVVKVDLPNHLKLVLLEQGMVELVDMEITMAVKVMTVVAVLLLFVIKLVSHRHLLHKVQKRLVVWLVTLMGKQFTNLHQLERLK